MLGVVIEELGGLSRVASGGGGVTEVGLWSEVCNVSDQEGRSVQW